MADKVAHVICMNDSVEHVVTDDEDKANWRLEELARKHYETVQHNYSSYETYRDRCFWHLHIVGYE